MGDAGPLTPPPALEAEIDVTTIEHEAPVREVTVLVTGFGPFKSFATNPSWLIASSLPSVLLPQVQRPLSTSTSNAKAAPYQIRLLVHPSPVRVAYATAATLLPQLIDTHNPDYILHIGMAGGRDHYTLETVAHRDGYKIKDVDERDGWKDGEHAWKRDHVPDLLHVGWDEKDVLARWEREVWELEDNMGLVDGIKGKDGKSVVRLSRDAGRFLCEFALMCSLSRRWLEARQGEQDEEEDHEENEWVARIGGNAESREGKVAFFHVPGGYSAEDVVRGRRVAEAVIRSLVGSWEAGRRRKEGDGTAAAGVERGRWEGVVWRA